jgi:tRNA-splicing ligase RtcB
VYTGFTEVAVEVALDMRALTGLDPNIHVRRRPNGSLEHALYVDSTSFVEQLAAAGAIVGRKAGRWGGVRVAGDPWSYLSGLASAEATTPAILHGRATPVVIKQKGRDAAEHVAEALAACGFAASVTPSGGGDVFAIQVTGGQAEAIRFYEQVGFCHEPAKRRAAAVAASHAWAARPARDRRGRIRAAVRARMATGLVRDAVARTAGEFGVSEAAVLHLAYRDGRLRTPRGWTHADRSLGESCWVPVGAITPDGVAPTYDVVTDDPEHAFVAGGIAVHNCGNKAARTSVLVEDLAPDVSRVMDEIFERISFGVGRKNDEPVDHPVLDAIAEADFAPQRGLRDLAAKQLGTVGAGNHYVDLFAGDDGHVWIGVHFGSRGFGHKTASGFLALAEGLPFGGRASEGEMDAPPTLLHVDSELGQSYISAMHLAGEYAYAGRDVVVDKVLEILGAESLYEVHNHHNFGWRERHFDTDVWVVRKGCTPAFPGQEGFVGATMGEPSVILRGTEDPAGRDLLYSTVHGAGRVMSRTRAAGKRRKRWSCTSCAWFQGPGESKPGDDRCPRCGSALQRRWQMLKAGEIDFGAVQRELHGAGIQLRGGAADEAPGAYKRLADVLAAHGDTVEVLHRLTPIGVAMAGADTFDPYKD